MCTVTVPHVSADGKVTQPNLRRGMPIEAIATAFGDLGAVVDGPGRFVDSSNDFFAERQLGIRLTLMRATSGGRGLSDDERQEIVRTAIGYSKYQVGFLESRKKQLRQDVKVIPHASARREVLQVYTQAYDRAIESMKQRRDRRISIVDSYEKDWFRTLLWDMGYTPPLVNAA